MDNPLTGLLSMFQGGQPQPIPPQRVQQPQMPPQASPMGDAFSASLRDILAGMAMGSTPQESMSMAGRVMAVHGGQREQQQRVLARQNQTLKWLQGQGVDANTASYLVSDPEAMRTFFAERQKAQTPHPSADITEYEYAKKQGFEGNFEQWIQRKRAGAGEYGMQPIWGTGADGSTAVLQLGKSGEAIQSKLPEGFKIARDPIKVEGPTGTTILDPQTRQQVGFIPKDVQGAAAAHTRGEAQGTAQASLPSALNNAEQTLKLVGEVIKHPGRSTATGASGTFDPRNYIPGTDAKDFQVRAEQIKGRTFLEAFQSLKGGGAITEREGQAASAAIARLNTAQSDAEYLNALNELKGIIAKGVEVLRQKAGVPGGGVGSDAVASAPGLADLKAKYGLD